MKITDITAQVKNQNRVNVIVDGVYRFSLDIFQVGELGIKVGKEYTEKELDALEEESVFGKLYARTLEYTLMRPHSAKEIRDYLFRKTRDTRAKDGSVKKGVPKVVTERVFERLEAKGYINDTAFARFWVENTTKKPSFDLKATLAALKKHGSELAHHLGFIVVIIMLAIIGYAIAQTSRIIGEATATSDGSSSTTSVVPSISSFNKKTIEQVNSLSDQTKTVDISLPGGRINPFSE